MIAIDPYPMNLGNQKTSNLLIKSYSMILAQAFHQIEVCNQIQSLTKIMNKLILKKKFDKIGTYINIYHLILFLPRKI